MNRIKLWLQKWLALAAPPASTARAGMSVSPQTLMQFESNSSNSFLARLGSKVVVARDIKPYIPPPGVIPSVTQRATDQQNDPSNAPFLAMDDGQNFSGFQTWLGSNYCGLGFPGYAYLSELSQRSEYRAPAETLAKEMTRKFIKFQTKGAGDKAGKIAKLEAWYKKHDVRQVIRKALELDLFFGRSQIFLDIKGQESDAARALPLVIDKNTIGKGMFRGFKVIEPIWTTPYNYNATDPTKADFYIPYAWYVLGRKVHHTRLIMVQSRPVPDMLKPAYNFGGISLTQLCEPYVLRWLKTVDSVNRIISNFSVLMLKTNMQQVLQGDAVAGVGLFDRTKMFVATRDNQGLMTLDKDTEEMDHIAVPLSGLNELQAQAQEHMAAPTHLPLVKLTGITPSGLNASSEGEIQVLYDYVMAENEVVVEPILDRILDIAQLDEFGEIDEDIDYEFVPLTEPTRREAAEMRKADVDGAVSLVQNNIISTDEAREHLQDDPESGYTNLSGSAPESPEPDPEQGGGEFPVGGEEET